MKLLQPYISRGRVAEWYRGTADAVLRNMNVLEHDPSDIVVVLAGDHIYKMDYQPFVAAHRRHRADVTIAVRRVPLAEASRMGILALDDADRVTEWQEKPKQPKSDLASMGVYVFSKKTLRRWLSRGPTGLRHARDPGDARGGRACLRLPVQRLLAGRRHDPVVLGMQHGPPRGRRRARPQRQGLGEVDGIVHYCVANMPGAVPMTSTRALTNATLPYVEAIADPRPGRRGAERPRAGTRRQRDGGPRHLRAPSHAISGTRSSRSPRSWTARRSDAGLAGRPAEAGLVRANGVRHNGDVRPLATALVLALALVAAGGGHCERQHAQLGRDAHRRS